MRNLPDRIKALEAEKLEAIQSIKEKIRRVRSIRKEIRILKRVGKVGI